MPNGESTQNEGELPSDNMRPVTPDILNPGDRQRGFSTSSIKSDASTVVESYARKENPNDRKILSIYERWSSYEDKTAEKKQLNGLLRTEHGALRVAEQEQQSISDLIEHAKSDLKFNAKIVQQERKAYASKGIFATLASDVYDFFVRNIFRRQTSLDISEEIYLKLTKKIEGYDLDKDKCEAKVENIKKEIDMLTRDLNRVETDISALNYGKISKQIKSLSSDATLFSKVSRLKDITAKLIAECEKNPSFSKMEKKDNTAVRSIQVALKDFLERPTEVTLASLGKVIRSNLEASETKSCSALLTSAANLYPEIKDYRKQEIQVTTRALFDSSSSLTGKIKENESKIKILEKEMHSLESLRGYIKEESDYLIGLKENLATLDASKSTIHEEDYEEDRATYLDGIAHGEQRLEKMILKLPESAKDVDGLDVMIKAFADKVDNLTEENQVITSSRNDTINAEIDKLILRCDAKKGSIGSSLISIIRGPQPEDMVKSALKVFILAPSIDSTKGLIAAQNNHPVTDQTEKTQLEKLINDALSLYQGDRDGYRAAVGARGPVERSIGKAAGFRGEMEGMRKAPIKTIEPYTPKKGI